MILFKGFVNKGFGLSIMIVNEIFIKPKSLNQNNYVLMHGETT